VLCLQEVESMAALRKFNSEFLGGYYGSALLVDSRDLRQIDVAVLTRLDILSARSHVDDPDPSPEDPRQPWLFSRDCLEVDLALNRSGSRRLTLFVNHLKSKYAESPPPRPWRRSCAPRVSRAPSSASRRSRTGGRTGTGRETPCPSSTTCSSRRP